MSMYKSQIQTEQIPPNSSECYVFASPPKKKEIPINSKPVQKKPPQKLSNQPQNEVQVQEALRILHFRSFLFIYSKQVPINANSYELRTPFILSHLGPIFKEKLGFLFGARL